MHPVIRASIALFAVFDCYLLAMAGFSWLEQGYGLNPWLALPTAAVFFIFALYHALKGVAEMFERDEQPIEDYDITEFIQEARAERLRRMSSRVE